MSHIIIFKKYIIIIEMKKKQFDIKNWRNRQEFLTELQGSGEHSLRNADLVN